MTINYNNILSIQSDVAIHLYECVKCRSNQTISDLVLDFYAYLFIDKCHEEWQIKKIKNTQRDIFKAIRINHMSCIDGKYLHLPTVEELNK
jgi:hypothetical protein